MPGISLLEAEPAFGVGLTPSHRKWAEQLLHVPTISLETGPIASELLDRTPHLVVGGLLLRRIKVRGGRSVELLGDGDVLVPGREDAASFARSEWTAVEATRLAALDFNPGTALARWPSVCAAISLRAIDRSRALALQAAVMSIVGIEDRLHVLFWALAERRGEMSREGVELSIGLSQEVLGEMVGARRPSVSSALGRLAERDLVLSRSPGRWLLKGDPPPLED